MGGKEGGEERREDERVHLRSLSLGGWGLLRWWRGAPVQAGDGGASTGGGGGGGGGGGLG